MGIGSSDSLRLVFLAFDFFLVAVSVFLVLLLINSPKGFRYLGILLISIILLITGSYFSLEGLHLLAQALTIILLVTLPVIFRKELVEVLEGTKNTEVRNKYVGIPALVIIAVVMAGVISLVGNGITTKTGSLGQNIVVAAVNLPDGLTANLGSNNTVKVVVSADRNKWSSLSPDSFSATVDVAKQTEGTYDLAVTVTSKINNVIVRNVEPSRMVVTVEPIIKKTVPVVAKFTGHAGNNLVPDVPLFTPDKVDVSGPKSVIGTLTQGVVIVNIEAQTQKITGNFAVVGESPSGDNIANITFEPAEVAASIDLIKAGKLKTVGVRPVIIGQPAAGYWVNQVSVTPSAVTVTGSVDVLDKLTQISTESVSINGLSADYSGSVNLSFPSGVTSADDTTKVTVKLSLTGSTSLKTITPTINYQNLNGALKVTSIDPTSVSTLVAGAISKLGSIDSQIIINLDLSAYKSAGTYSVTITKEMFTLPDGINLVSFLPSAIDVKLDNK